MGKYCVERQIITPEIAKIMLMRNSNNRKVRQLKVEAYARTIKAGLWMLTNQGIGFNIDGDLIDGQHRLLACIMANTGFETYVTFGMEKEAQRVIDGCVPRSVPDQLQLSGTTNAKIKVAIAACIISAVAGASRVAMSIDIAEKVIDLYSDEIDFIWFENKCNKKLKYVPAITGIILAAKVDLDKAVEFRDKYSKGDNLSLGDSALTLRNFMMNRDTRGHGGGKERKTILCCSATALAYYFQNKALKKITASTIGIDYLMNRQQPCVKMIKSWLKI